MLLIGDQRILNEAQAYVKDLVIFDLYSMVQNRFPKVHKLIPPNNILRTPEEIIDQYYYDYIMSFDSTFMEMMRVVRELYLGKNVLLLTYRHEAYDSITELITTYILNRYGYMSIYLNEPEDVLGLPVNDTGEFSLAGLANLDIDNDRYEYIVVNNNLPRDTTSIRNYTRNISSIENIKYTTGGTNGNH